VAADAADRAATETRLRIPSRVPEWARQEHREQWRRDRAAAQPMRSAFPAVQLLHIELVFEDPESQPPAAQAHALHPPAPAFFAFPCPYANCNGSFDLSEAVRRMMKATSSQAAGVLDCSGMRTRDGVAKRACGVHVRYAISTKYQPD
jgi:hypothetical protein